MKALLLFLILLPFNTYSQEEVCEHDHGLLDGELSQLIDWFGAKDKQVENAPCKSKFIPSEKKMLDFISQKDRKKAVPSKTIHGVTFKNESPALIDAFKNLTTLYDSMGILEQKEQKDFQKEYQINPECHKVLCALKKIWGENATKMLYIKLKHNYNTSELAFNNSTRFTGKELDDVLLGLEDIPEHLVPIGNPNQRLTRFLEGYTLKDYGPGVMANAVIMLFDLWKDDSSTSRQYTIFHEVSHNMASRLDEMDYNPEWLKLSSWIKKGDDWTSKEDACFPSKYSATNPAEDFAETATTYRYNGKGLKENCPEKYAFMKKHVFKGIEYTDEKLCLPPSDAQLSVARKEVGKDLISLLSSKKYEDEEINEHCKGQFNSFPPQAEDAAACALQIQLKTNLRPQIRKAMEKLGIEESGFQEDLFAKTLVEDLKSDELFFESVMKRTSPLTEKASSLVNDEINKAFSQPISAEALRLQLNLATRNCGQLLFSKGESEVLDCYLKELIARDESNRSWDKGFLPTFNPPALFSKEANEAFKDIKTAKLKEILTKHPTVVEKQQNLKKELHSDLEWHFREVSKEIKKLPRWKDMSPKEFCEASYGKSTLWLANFGLKTGETSPILIEKCIKVQSQKTKRFELNGKHAKDFTN